MAKTKLHKYERVRHLSNVIFSEFGESKPPLSYPWHDKKYKGMEIVLELGCGKGEHTIAFGAADKSRLFVGIDSKSHRICTGAEKAIFQGLENVIFLRARIERIQDFFQAHSINEIWLTFPDPHTKNRSIKNRLSAPFFLNAYANLLIPGGTVHLKTDSDLLYNYTMESVALWGGQVISDVHDLHKTDTHGIDTCEIDDLNFGASTIVSTFESRARSNGASIKYMVFRLS